MPYRKRYKRKNLRRKRRYKGRKMRRRNRMSYAVNRRLITPDTQYVKLRIQRLHNVLGLLADGFNVSGNSAFDPLKNLGSSQMEGFDAWANLYNSYEVSASACKLTFINHSSAHVNLYLQPSSDGANPGNSAIVGNPYGKTKILSPLVAGGVARIGGFMRTKKLMGRTTADTIFTALVTADPLQEWTWLCRMSSSDGVSTLNLQCKIQLTYYVKFFDRRVQVDAA